MGTPTHALLAVVGYGCLGLELWAIVDCVVRPTAGFVAAGKLTKPAWLAITIIAAFVTYLFGVLGFGIAGVIAAIVYLVDVRPAVREVQGGGNRW
ncbi:MAG: DUF2516 family protein [Mycobacteriales bacterium]|nr:MAG: DUF2516 domain-containing protein [Pseudonocardiales bacterium]